LPHGICLTYNMKDQRMQQIFKLDHLQDLIHRLTFYQEKVLFSISPLRKPAPIAPETTGPVASLTNIYGEILTEKEKLHLLLEEVKSYKESLLQVSF
jgi:hypothetical protein